MARNTAPTKPLLDQRDLSAVILAAGEGRRLRTHGSRSLIQVGAKTLIEHQIATVRSKFPDIHEIVIVLGYDAEKVYRALPNGVKVVENEKFFENNSIRSLGIALRICLTNHLLILPGDLYFDKTIFAGLDKNSALILDSHKRINHDKIGVMLEGSRILRCDYGFEKKWAQIAYLVGREIDMIKELSLNRTKDNLCLFEGLNHIIEKGGNIQGIESSEKAKLFEFNTVQDIERFK